MKDLTQEIRDLELDFKREQENAQRDYNSTLIEMENKIADLEERNDELARLLD